MSAVLLPPGVNAIAVNKCIILHHIKPPTPFLLRYPLNGRLFEVQIQSGYPGEEKNLLPLSGIEYSCLVVQSVTSYYTVCVIPSPVYVRVRVV